MLYISLIPIPIAQLYGTEIGSKSGLYNTHGGCGVRKYLLFMSIYTPVLCPFGHIKSIDNGI